MRPTPYIGVTGFTNVSQAVEVRTGIPQLKSDRKIMVGVLLSDKSLARVTGPEASNPKRYPVPELIPSIFAATPDTLNVIHLSTSAPDVLIGLMYKGQELAGKHCHGFQLNVTLPSVRTLASYKALDIFEHKVVVLQFGRRALAELDNSPIKIAETVKVYEGVVDYVLIDESGGTGRALNLNFTMRCLNRLAKFDTLGLVVAGGLQVENLWQLEPILREFPGMISIDIESGVRDERDHLAPAKAIHYVTEANDIIGRHEPL